MVYDFDVVIIGSGVIGLSCGKFFVEQGLSTLIVESEHDFGVGTSSRNSEVIHAGIYYSYNSNKARLCVRGRRMLYEYCFRKNIPCKKIGKLIAAQTANQIQDLHKLNSLGVNNGLNDLRFLSAKCMAKIEPELRASEVLYSPSTGIIDSYAYMQSLMGDIQQGGGIAVYRTPFLHAEIESRGFVIKLGGVDPVAIKSRVLINSAGLNAIKVAERIAGLPVEKIPRSCFAKGTYFKYAGKVPFQHLIYPVPEVGGLGIHLTLDMNGQGRFGPDVEWIEEPNYNVNEESKRSFALAVKTYWPGCDESKLQVDFCGVRPKLGNSESFSNDFLVQKENDHGVGGLVNLFGIESPGLTASLAIGEDVVQSVLASVRF